jgi:hypothetical protein
VFASNYLASPNRKRSLTIRLEFRSHAGQPTNRETLDGLDPSTAATMMDGEPDSY